MTGGCVGSGRGGRAQGYGLRLAGLMAAFFCAVGARGSLVMAQEPRAQDGASRGSLPPTEAAAPTPVDAALRELAANAAKLASKPEGILPILELWARADWAPPGLVPQLLEGLASGSALTPDRRAFVRGLLARAQLQQGAPAEAAATVESLAYVTAWHVVGPFDNEGKAGFDRAAGPELALLGPRDTETAFEGASRPVYWRRYPEDASRHGYVDFDAVMEPNVNVCSYAETTVSLSASSALLLRFGAGGSSKLWWNGALVFEDPKVRAPYFDRHAVAVQPREGLNRILIKVCGAEQPWGFFLRLATLAGDPAQGVRAAPDMPTALPELRQRRAPRHRHAASDFEALWRSSRSGAPDALEQYVRFLALTGSDDTTVPEGPLLAEQAVRRGPTLARLLLASELAAERSEAVGYAERAVALDPQSRDARLSLAALSTEGIDPARALPALEALSEGADLVSLRARVLRAEVLANLGLVDGARSLLAEGLLADQAPVAWRKARVDLAHTSGRTEEALSRHRALLSVRFDQEASRKTLARDALMRGSESDVRRHIEALLTAAPSVSNRRFAAGLLQGLGRQDEAISLMQAALAIRPEDATLLESLAQLQLHGGQREAARQSLARALSFRPQDVAIRSLLEHIAPNGGRDDARYAATSEAILARRVPANGFPVTVLQSLTVNTVFESGLGSSFRQYAAQAHNDEGTRVLKTFSIRFDPTSQEVRVERAWVHRQNGTVLESTQTFDQPLGEPWYRIYYDTRALVVVFPDLDPGDTVELRYRIDDVGERNYFANYYGDLQFIAGSYPVAHFEYVLRTTPTKEFYFNDIGANHLEHTRTVDNGLRVDRFVRLGSEALRSEPRMPGLTEIAPYLHVSTYQTWEQVGRWWWGLIRDQLQADDALRDVVRGLVADVDTTEEKVARIQNWVVRNTRYVGLEFGIHGYKPYRVPSVVQRGFGDCKDKASLLYVMLREAGIDAQIALVRTRHNGRIQDLPASLAVFDHAIAYVPVLDRFIDGTAEFAGSKELPAGDQGVTVLLVGPQSVTLRLSPVLPAHSNLKEKYAEVTVEADGTGAAHVTEVVHGVDAARYRELLAVEGTRQERLERQLREFDPGTVLVSEPAVSVTALEEPVRVEYDARIPSFGLRSGDELQILPSSVGHLTQAFAPLVERRHAVETGVPFVYRERRTVRVPLGFHLRSLPPSQAVTSAFGTLRFDSEVTGDTVSIDVALSLDTDRVPPGSYGAFRQFVSAADEVLRRRIVLVREGSGAP